MKNKFTCSIIFIALLIAFTSVAVAADVDSGDTAGDISASVAANDVAQTVDAPVSVSDNGNDNKIIKNTQQATENVAVKENSGQTRNTTPTVWNISNANFSEIVTSSGLNSSVSNGDTLNFVSDVTRTGSSFIIDKPITILGNQYTLNLNTGLNYAKTSLNFVSGASNSNITGLNLLNTQVYVNTSSNITFDNIHAKVNNSGVGAGVGSFAIRDGSINVTVKNSNFETYTNGGYSTLVLTWSKNCTIENNTVYGTGNVGNLVYLNNYGGKVNDNGIVNNSGNIIKDNTITAVDPGMFCYALTITGANNSIINNTISNNRNYSVTTTWAGSYEETNPGDTHNVSYHGNKYINNTISGKFSTGNYSIVEGNWINGVSTIVGHANVTNNTFLGPITINNNVRFHSNNAAGQTVTVILPDSCFKNSTVGTLTIPDTVYPTYDCGENTITNHNYTDGFFVPCPNCPNCVINSKTLSKNIKASVKTATPQSTVIDIDGGKEIRVTNYIDNWDQDVEFVYQVYDNGTMNIYINTTWQADQLDPNSHNHIPIDNWGVEIRDIVVYFNDTPVSGKFELYLDDNIINRSNVNIKYVSNVRKIDGFVFSKGPYKTTIFENFNLQNEITVGNDVTVKNSNLIIPPQLSNGNIIDYRIGNNTLIENCNISSVLLKGTYISFLNRYNIKNGGSIGTNNTFINNIFTYTTNTTSMDDFDYFGLPVPIRGDDNTITNNEFYISYLKGINIFGSNNIFENNTVYVRHSDYTINITGDNNVVRYNTLTSKSGEGDSTVVVTGENNVVKQNPYVEPSAANYTFKLYSGQYVGAEYNGTLYNNGTLIINITSLNTNYQYDTLKINSQELFTEVKNMVLYIKYSSTMLPKDFGFKLKFDGIDKNNVDLTYIFDNDQYSAKMFDFMLEFKSDFKSTTFENFNLLIRNEINDDEPVYVGIKVNSNVILRNCNIEINLPDSFDEKVIDLSENTLIENCTFTYDVPLIFYFDDSHTDYWEEDGLVFTSTGQGNTTINNNVFIINSFEKSHDFEAVEYAFGIVVSGENFIFTNNEVNVRYVRPILITSSNAIIENNTIASMDTDYTINITGDNNIVRYNTLTAGENEGDATVITTGTGNIVRDNPYVEVVDPVLKVDTVEFVAGSTSNIQASIYLGDDVASDVNKGKVTFKVNGKTLKDASGKTIYAKVTGGVAVIEDYLIPESWAKDTVSIVAVYSGSADYAKLSSEKVDLTVTSAQAEEPSITTRDVSAAAGETITLSATIADNDKVINSGKVVFKINGKTVKNADGKVIYAKVVNNQVSFEYTLPESMKAKEYNITAVYTGNDYRLEDTKTLTVN